MLKKLTVLVFVLFTVSLAIAQTGSVKGKMLDKDNNEPLPFANVVIKKGGVQVAGTMTDFDGEFTFNALTPGSYDIEASYVGYQPIKIAAIIVKSGKITFVKDIKASAGQTLDDFEVISYKVPLIDPDQTSSGATITSEDIKKMPGRSAASIAATVGGVSTQDDGSGLSLRGSDAGSSDTYIDGIKVRGSQALPKSAIEEVSVIVGGIPAQFGDITGGIINITTKGASKDWFGGIEYTGSGFKNGDKVIGLDNYGFNLLGFSLSGPILTKKDSVGNKKDAIAGFFFSGELSHSLDNRPVVGGESRISDDLLNQLNENPYSSGGEAGGVINNASFIRATDLEKTPFRLNASSKAINLAGKIDITTSKTTNVSFGGNFVASDGNRYNRLNSLFNPDNDAQILSRNWRTFARFTQRFENSSDEDNPSLIKDAFITFQVDYSKSYVKNQNRKHGDNLSHYGYIGKFTTDRELVYNYANIDTAAVVDADGNATGHVVRGFFSNFDTRAYNFEAGDLNPILANYNRDYYSIYENDPTGNTDNIENVQSGGGLLNGGTPASIYGLYGAMGVPDGSYGIAEGSQFRVMGQGSATIKDHAIKVGFEYEQRESRSFQANPFALWGLGRRSVNTQIAQLSFVEGTYDSTVFNNGINEFTFQQAYDGAVHTTFDKNLRASLGMAEDGLNWIDFDSYGPDVWSLDMFSPDELINNGVLGANGAGYDFKGKKLSGNPTLDDFFNEVDENGDFTRKVGSFRPIYVAGFIQDKFAFDDLIFNIGVRLDRYDANQSVLKDQYSLFPTKTVGEIANLETPSNIGSDYVVYVADAANPNVKDVVGYRNGDVWFNADGQEISDPSVLSSVGIPQPWLVDPNNNNVFRDLDAESFRDYKPQVRISPRIAFSFPISDEALFFAHYDVLTQRPSSGAGLSLLSYLLFNTGGGSISNPDLKPEQTIDYELGFQQKLNNYSSLKVSAFYREIRDEIRSIQIVGAYPGNYFTFANRDFGTTKGMTVSYDLRTRGNVSLRASYTLQFAETSGNVPGNLISSGNGNLRTLSPKGIDQRHVINLAGDYRYSSGKNYNGPVIFGKDILQNTGLNLTMIASSGRPYTKIDGSRGFVGQGNSFIQGQLNTARLPFFTTVNAKIDRTVDVKWGKGEDGDRKEASLNVYIQVLNVLNSINVSRVYPSTGNPDDDGFLSASQQQTFIVNQIDEQSFRDLYQTRVNNGENYFLPRRIRLGIQLNF